VRGLGEALAQAAKRSPGNVPTLEAAIKAAKEAAKPWYQRNK
jgi:hypothetical protein